MLEVEIKAKAKIAESRLIDLGAVGSGVEVQVDQYFNSPTRDFRLSDEALRVRKVNDSYRLTYKGPRIDSNTKSREELEIVTEPEMVDILKKLGFVPAAVVKKTRRLFTLGDITICLDEVEGLGSFIELEVASLEAKEGLFDLFSKLGIKRDESITKSYLELLEEKII